MAKMLSRRDALALAPVALAAVAVPAVAAPAAAAPVKSTLGEVLIALHRWKVNAANAAYRTLGDLEERHRIPRPKVHYSFHKQGGEKVPLYAFSEAELDEKLAAHERPMWSIYPDRQDVRDRLAARREVFMREWRDQEERHAQAERESGITAARVASDEAEEEERHAVRCLTGARYRTQAELLAVLGYMLNGMNEDAMLFEPDDFVMLARSQTGVEARTVTEEA